MNVEHNGLKNGTLVIVFIRRKEIMRILQYNYGIIIITNSGK